MGSLIRPWKDIHFSPVRQFLLQCLAEANNANRGSLSGAWEAGEHSVDERVWGLGVMGRDLEKSIWEPGFHGAQLFSEVSGAS